MARYASRVPGAGSGGGTGSRISRLPAGLLPDQPLRAGSQDVLAPRQERTLLQRTDRFGVPRVTGHILVWWSQTQ